MAFSIGNALVIDEITEASFREAKVLLVSMLWSHQISRRKTVMTEKDLFEKLRTGFISLLMENNIEDTAVEITCRTLSPIYCLIKKSCSTEYPPPERHSFLD